MEVASLLSCLDWSNLYRHIEIFQLFGRRPCTMLDFWNVKFSTACREDMSQPAKMHHRAKFRDDRSNRCWDMVIFLFSRMAANVILDIQIFWNFNGRNGQYSRNPSPCQISKKSIKSGPRSGHFSISQHGGRLHLGLLKLQDVNFKTSFETPQDKVPCSHCYPIYHYKTQKSN